MNDSKITSRQFFVLVFLFTVGSSILFVPSQVADAAKHDTWLAILIGFVINLLVVGLYLLLSRCYPDTTLYELMEKLLGKWIGYLATALTFLFAFIVCLSSLFYYVGYFLNTQIFPDTPVVVLNGLFAIIAILGVRLGRATFSRASEVLVGLFLFLYVFLIFTVAPEIEMENLKPALTTPVTSLLDGALGYVSFSTFPLIFFLTLYPAHVLNPRQAAKNFMWGTLTGGAVLWIISVVSIAVFGPEVTKAYTFPSYVLAQRINIGTFLTRVEVIMPTIWLISLFFKCLIYFYASVEGLARLTRVRSSQLYTIPIGLAAWALSVDLYTDSAHLYVWSKKTLPVITFIFGVLLPLILLGLALLKRGRESSRGRTAAPMEEK
ncbi:endospore germination permease [Paenibacillus sp. J2TS4]|uniref:GerAB/ArcD/ProY family transporter n=1 Tax=Paenibacillus sp. J2TS4 TaxID=2807194 RepID=UPI001B2BE4C7|nr:endospore germination permease [Paenibacillus sp. J2TS4]GIP32622.1 hypothetical protein J2TS4_18320 [Paenibacillus sp. J2TS4]